MQNRAIALIILLFLLFALAVSVRGVRSGFRFRKRHSVSVQSQRGPLDEDVDALRCRFLKQHTRNPI